MCHLFTGLQFFLDQIRLILLPKLPRGFRRAQNILPTLGISENAVFTFTMVIYEKFVLMSTFKFLELTGTFTLEIMLCNVLF